MTNDNDGIDAIEAAIRKSADVHPAETYEIDDGVAYLYDAAGVLMGAMPESVFRRLREGADD